MPLVVDEGIELPQVSIVIKTYNYESLRYGQYIIMKFPEDEHGSRVDYSLPYWYIRQCLGCVVFICSFDSNGLLFSWN